MDGKTKYEWISDIRNNEMKITKTQLKQIIKEELEAVMDERMGLPADVPVEAGSPEDLKRRCNAAGVSNDEWADCIANPAPFEEKAARLRKSLDQQSADDQVKLRNYRGSPWKGDL
jgi:hypothetical protein